MDRDTILQALVAALMFGQDAGLAASEDHGSNLYPGGGCAVRISEDAKALLAEAQALLAGFEPTRKGYGMSVYDFTSN